MCLKSCILYCYVVLNKRVSILINENKKDRKNTKKTWGYLKKNQGKSEGFHSCDRPSNLKLDSNQRFFSPCDHEIWWMTSKNNRVLLLSYVKLCASFQVHWWIPPGVTVQKFTLNLGRNWRYFILCDLKILWMTLENNRAILLYHIKLCAPFQSHRWSQSWVTVRKHSIRVKIGNFLSHVTLKFDGWPWKNNRAPLHFSFKLCASFHSHWWIQTGVTVRKRSIWFKIGIFFRVTLKFDEWPKKTIGYLFYTTLRFVHHFKAMS